MLQRRLFMALLALVITGCGFQLRGSLNLPTNLHSMTVDGPEPYSPLLVHTRELLKSAGIETPDDAPYTLYVIKEELGKTRFTQNQNVLYDEFMLTHMAKFELRRKDGSLIAKPQELSDMALFQDDQSTAGTKLNEENILRDEVAQKLSVKILRRIQAIKPSQWEAKATETTKGVGTDTLDAPSSDAKSNDKNSGDTNITPASDNTPAATTAPAASEQDAPAP